MARQRKQEPKQYCVYLGKRREFPKGETIVHGDIYETKLFPPTPDNTFYKMLVETNLGGIYVPYQSMKAIYEEWMPYGGYSGD